MIVIQPISPEQTYPLRHRVLWPDKPLDYVKVENDDQGYHFGAFQNGTLIAVISLFVDKQVARFRKFATDPAFQRQGVGTQLLNHVIGEAKKAGAETLWCDARLDAAAFYERFGMAPVSDVFYKGPIPYARFSMRLV